MHTHRQMACRWNIWQALGRCPELGAHNTVQLDEARSRFVERHLLPALNRRDDDGWDILPALQQLATGASGPDAPAMRAAAALLVRAVEGIELHFNKGRPREAEDREYFRVWPKGEGVVLLRAEGLPAGAFLGQYLEELYAGWRWLERDNTTTGRGFGRAPLACGWAHRPSFTMRWWSGRPVMRAVMMCSL